MSNSDSDITENNSDFGSLLAEARKSQNYTVSEINGYLKIPTHVIEAIEANDMDALPPPTFTQGYIRAYAKFLEISEDSVLDMYSRAVPHAETTKLKPRSNLPNEASSQSPLIKTMTMLLIIAGVAAAIYGSFRYYQEKADVMEYERELKDPGFTGNSLDSPGANSLDTRKNANLTDNDELLVEQSHLSDKMTEAQTTQIDTVETNHLEDTDSTSVSDEAGASEGLVAASEEARTMPENDVIEFFAENGSWMEVHDASNTRLFYNMVPKGGTRKLLGQAPFRVSLGNAKTTRVVINDIEIDMTKFIRPNNTAKFTVSTEEKNVIFNN